MEGTQDSPILLFDGSTSPHTATLLPEQIKALNQAKILFYIGPGYETNLTKYLKPLINKDSKTKIIDLVSSHNLSILKIRTNPIWGEQVSCAHHDHEHHDHDHTNHHHHDHFENSITQNAILNDTHIWLNPKNVKVIAQVICDNLITYMPQHDALLKQNLALLLSRLDDLDKDLTDSFQDFSKTPFIVFHDAYQYLEKAYNLKGLGAIRLDPHQETTAKHLKDLSLALKKNNVNVIFTEPQFNSDTALKLAERFNLKVGQLDPLGADINPGKEAYFQMMQNLKINLIKHLKP